jgi:hypothetical protein
MRKSPRKKATCPGTARVKCPAAMKKLPKMIARWVPRNRSARYPPSRGMMYTDHP